MSKRMLVFVCTGNMCRSPIAEYLLRDRLGSNADWQIASAGVLAADGQAASAEAIRVMAERGIDMAGHRSRMLDRELVDAASLVVVMTGGHRDQIRLLHPHPEVMQKMFLLKSFDTRMRGGDVDDPIGMSVEVYRGVRDEIDAALPGLMAFMKSLEFWR